MSIKPTVLFVKPAQETDLVWDPIRMSPNLGLWYLASHLRERGYPVRYLDETTRAGGQRIHALTHRTIVLSQKDGEVDEVFEQPVTDRFEALLAEKANDFEKMSPAEFVTKHSAFRVPGEIHRTVVRTGVPLEVTLTEIDRELTKGGPIVVGIPLPATANYVSATRLGRAIKEHFGVHAKVIFGGQHVTAMPREFLKDNPWVDLLVCGDAISTIEHAIHLAITGSSEKQIWREGGRQEDITEYPLLDPSLLEENAYPARPNHTYDTEGRRWVDFMFSKGCARMCAFCGVSGIPKTEKKYSAIVLDRLREQLMRFQRAGISELVIQDDAVLSNRLLPDVVRLLKELGFSWQNNGGIEFEKLNDQIVDQWCAFNSYGDGRFTALYVPFNPREWNEGQSAGVTQTQRYPHQVELLRRLREAGVYVFSSEIIAQPTEPREVSGVDAARYVDLVRQGYLDQALTFSATVLPGTAWYWQHGSLIVSKSDYLGHSLFTTHHRTRTIDDPRDIERWVIERNQTLNAIQTSYAWGTAFPNAGPPVGG